MHRDQKFSPVYSLLISAAAAAVFFVFPTLSAAAAGGEQIMKLVDIKTGMTGVGRTVVSGSLIEEFDVEVLGVLKNNKLDDALQISGSSVLVKVSGEVIIKSGGIAAGMSGSPVYIDGKLAGAVSSGWIMTDHTIGLMTPIEEMLGLFKYIKPGDKKKIDVNGLIDRDAMLFIEKSPAVGNYRGVLTGNGPPDDETLRYAARRGLMVFQNAATPVMVTGLNDRNYGRLKNMIKKRGHDISLVSSPQTVRDDSGDFEIPDLRPGHAIALQLVRGDINVTAIGTLTYLKENKFLAFAHSFMKKGDCSFFFAPANIYHCFFSHEMPFKIGTPGKLAGSVLVDRNEGIAGLIGLSPKVATVRASVVDLDNGVKKEFCTQLIKDRTMFAELLQAVLTQAVDEGINRQGAGFARASYKMTGRSEKSGEFVIERRNYHYDLYDIASVAIDEILGVAGAVALNQFEKADIYDIDVTFEISEQSPCAKVSEVSINSGRFEKGGSVEVSVTVEGDYQKAFSETFTVPVPLNMNDGEYNLAVTNADYAARSLAAEEYDLGSASPDELELSARKNAVSFKDLVRVLNDKAKNNQIKIEFEPAGQAEAPSSEGSAAASGEKNTRVDKGAKKHRELPSLDIIGQQKEGAPEAKSAGARGRLRPASSSGERISETVSGLKAQYYSNNPEPAEENYKFYKSFEFVFYPFSARFPITIGAAPEEAGEEVSGIENQKNDDMMMKTKERFEKR
jgi:hypothetical protein